MISPAALKQRLVFTATEPYRAAGRFAYHFARGKLAGDPAFTAILAGGLIPDQARVLDLGCGQGLLAAWLLAADACHRAGEWCGDWPAPSRLRSLQGIELMTADVERARRALGPKAAIEVGDIRSAPFGDADAIVILDVLHYIDRASQETILDRVRAALSYTGVLLLRIGDADAGLPFKISNWVDQTVLMARGHGWVRLHCRPVTEWLDVLSRRGFRTDPLPMSAGTPFANVLLVARPR